MPMVSVTAKPRTAPDPSQNRTRVEISVVMLESMMVVIARLYPASMAATGDLPECISSRMRSLMSTLASTAMPMVSTMPAMPGRVRVEPISDSTPKMMAMLIRSAMLANTPKSP